MRFTWHHIRPLQLLIAAGLLVAKQPSLSALATWLFRRCRRWHSRRCCWSRAELIFHSLPRPEIALQSVGFKEPDDVSIQAAVALNDKFIDDLQAIYQQAQGLMIKHDD
jgi:hypothetical protein